MVQNNIVWIGLSEVEVRGPMVRLRGGFQLFMFFLIVERHFQGRVEDKVLLEILARRHDNTYLNELFVKFPVFYLDVDFNFQEPPPHSFSPYVHIIYLSNEKL